MAISLSYKMTNKGNHYFKKNKLQVKLSPFICSKNVDTFKGTTFFCSKLQKVTFDQSYNSPPADKGGGGHLITFHLCYFKVFKTESFLEQKVSLLKEKTSCVLLKPVALEIYWSEHRLIIGTDRGQRGLSVMSWQWQRFFLQIS